MMTHVGRREQVAKRGHALETDLGNPMERGNGQVSNPDRPLESDRDEEGGVSDR
jgi:hypothetical protein